MVAAPDKPPQKFLPPCETQEKALSLIEAYSEKWCELYRGYLCTIDWDAVAASVGIRCPGAFPTKTFAQCRHKMEKPDKEPIMVLPGSIAAIAFLLITLSAPLICLGIRSFPARTELGSDGSFGFAEAPEYRNGVDCPVVNGGSGKGVGTTSCDASLVHVAMTLDSEYLRGSMAAVHSVLRHTSCPENLFFHLIAAEFDPVSPRVLTQLVRSTFPSLSFKVYIPSD
ncbi:hypothetical protein RJ640_015419 [Escallonia rubra]|uniref:Uncharacterized protein n=1 Tax=Escallonia rubra TaxID=112253 RepID=A0AA88QMH7_9ASTE|nr:hypothetical protein RJ640_015419 [Escallonia rubra]